MNIDLNLDNEIKKEYRNLENWLEQVANISYSLIYALVIWALLTTVMVGMVCIISIISGAFNDIELTDLQSGIKTFTILCGGFSAVAVILFSLPKRLRNVFEDIARNRIERAEKIQDDADFILALVDARLTEHGLIKDDNS